MPEKTTGPVKARKRANADNFERDISYPSDFKNTPKRVSELDLLSGDCLMSINNRPIRIILNYTLYLLQTKFYSNFKISKSKKL